MSLFILDKNNFRTELGRQLAHKYFGYTYDEEQYRAAANVVPVESRVEPIPQGLSVEMHASEVPSLAELHHDPIFTFSEPLPNVRRTQPRNTLTLHDLVQYFRHQGVVEEESLCCAITLAAINGSSFGVEGYSGSGKTFIVDKLVRLLPDVYTVQQSSDQAIFRVAEQLNSSRFVYIPELQKAMQNKKAPIIEVIKDLTEGKDANKIVTAKDGSGVVEYSIKSGITIIYTLAVENQFKKDDESSRRLIRFMTDASPDHLEAIHRSKAQGRYTLGMDEDTRAQHEARIREHLEDCIGLRDVHVIDPFADYIAELVPKTQKSVSYVDHYYRLIDASTRFHFNQRMSTSVNGKTYLFAALEDHFHVYGMYFTAFVETLRELMQAEEQAALDAIRHMNWEDCFASGERVMRTSPQLHAVRRRQGALEEWLERQRVHCELTSYDYSTGDTVSILQGDHHAGQ